MELPSVSSENLSSAVSDASPITMRWEGGRCQGLAELHHQSPRTPRLRPPTPLSARGSHLGHRHCVLARLEGSTVTQGEHAAQRPPRLRGLVKCLPWRPGIQAGAAKGLSRTRIESPSPLDSRLNPGLGGTHTPPHTRGRNFLSRPSIKSLRRPSKYQTSSQTRGLATHCLMTAGAPSPVMQSPPQTSFINFGAPF